MLELRAKYGEFISIYDPQEEDFVPLWEDAKIRHDLGINVEKENIGSRKKPVFLYKLTPEGGSLEGAVFKIGSYGISPTYYIYRDGKLEEIQPEVKDEEVEGIKVRRTRVGSAEETVILLPGEMVGYVNELKKEGIIKDCRQYKSDYWCRTKPSRVGETISFLKEKVGERGKSLLFKRDFYYIIIRKKDVDPDVYKEVKRFLRENLPSAARIIENEPFHEDEVRIFLPAIAYTREEEKLQELLSLLKERGYNTSELESELNKWIPIFREEIEKERLAIHTERVMEEIRKSNLKGEIEERGGAYLDLKEDHYIYAGGKTYELKDVFKKAGFDWDGRHWVIDIRKCMGNALPKSLEELEKKGIVITDEVKSMCSSIHSAFSGFREKCEGIMGNHPLREKVAQYLSFTEGPHDPKDLADPSKYSLVCKVKPKEWLGGDDFKKIRVFLEDKGCRYDKGVFICPVPEE